MIPKIKPQQHRECSHGCTHNVPVNFLSSQKYCGDASQLTAQKRSKIDRPMPPQPEKIAVPQVQWHVLQHDGHTVLALSFVDTKTGKTHSYHVRAKSNDTEDALCNISAAALERIAQKAAQLVIVANAAVKKIDPQHVGIKHMHVTPSEIVADDQKLVLDTQLWHCLCNLLSELRERQWWHVLEDLLISEPNSL